MINDSATMGSTELPTTTTSNGPEGFTVKTGLARMLKGGVIMDVVNAEQVYYLLFPYHSPHPPRNLNGRNLTFAGTHC